MKVLLVNGSPHEKGCTYAGLMEIARVLKDEGVDSEIFWLGKDAIAGCTGCGACSKTGRCVIDDVVNVFLEKAKTTDGFVFGTPVHFASASGAITAFMDRAFCSKAALYMGKPAAAIASCRRGGASAALDQLNKYFPICGMPMVPSQYWNMIHGSKPEDVAKDEEGMQTMRTLARNMAWMLKCIEAGKNAGVLYPERETPIKTNFVR